MEAFKEYKSSILVWRVAFDTYQLARGAFQKIQPLVVHDSEQMS
jgi:hypothetical protein